MSSSVSAPIPGLLVYRPDKGNDKYRGDQHERPGRDKAQRDEEDGPRLRRIPGLSGPHEGEQGGEEREKDEDHAPRQVPYLDRRPLYRVGHAAPGRIAALAHALDGPPELALSGEPDDPREIVRFGRRLAHPEELQVVAPVQFDGPGVRRGELLQEGMGVEAGGVPAGLVLGGAGLAPARDPAGDLGDLQKEHFAGELYGALSFAAPGGDLRPYATRAVFLAPQMVDLLLVEVPLLQRVGRIPQAVGLF